MTRTTDTEYTRYARTLQGAVELAAAAATAEVSRILHRISNTSPRKQTQVADLLEVTEGRVSQVLNGDGNVKIAALAKYARAFGYKLSFTLTPAERDIPPLVLDQPRRRRTQTESVSAAYVDAAQDYFRHRLADHVFSTTPAAFGSFQILQPAVNWVGSVHSTGATTTSTENPTWT